MGIDIAIDELYASGWSTLDSTGCEYEGGRQYPSVELVTQEFERNGLILTIRRIELFDCFRAEWRTAKGEAVGAVVGQSDSEAAVYALAQMRRAAALA